MRPKRIDINGKSLLEQRDIFGCPIYYDKCQESLTGQFFLNLRSLQHFLGTYDIWQSKDGDTLTIEFYEGKMVFEFSRGRFWLVVDYLEQYKIREKFSESHPNAENIEVHDDYLTAIMDDEEVRFLYKYRRSNLEFKEFDRKPVFQQENLEGEIICLKNCYYRQGKVCRYFDWQLEQHCTEIPECEDPFAYTENMVS